MARPKYTNLEHMMHPKSVAIIGASSNPDKVGHIILQNYIDVGFSGKLYPVNINAGGNILGLKSYKRIKDVNDAVDLAVIAVPAAIVPSILDECGRAGVKSAVVVSGALTT